MNNRLLTYLLLCSFFFMGCKKEGQGLFYQHVYVTVNPEVRSIFEIDDASVGFTPNGALEGYGNYTVFQTNDFFNTVEKRSVVDIGYLSNFVYKGFDRMIKQDGKTLKIYKSVNQALEKTVTLQFGSGESQGASYFLASDKAWFLTTNATSGKTQVYQYDGSQTNLLCVMNADSYKPETIRFLNEYTGWMIARNTSNNALKVYRSSDSGQTWNLITSLSGSYADYKYWIGESSVMLYSYDTYSLRRCSKLGAVTTINTTSAFGGKEVSDFELLDEYGLIYAVASNGGADDGGNYGDFYKSEDNGLSWTRVNAKNLYSGAMNFYDKNVGVVYSGKMVQASADGGATWHLIACKF